MTILDDKRLSKYIKQENNISYDEKTILNIYIKIEPEILEEVSNYFPRMENEQFPIAIRALFGGKRTFTVFFSKARTESFEDCINMILASDSQNNSNNFILKFLNNQTLSFYCMHEYNALKINKITTVPSLVGSKNNRSITANVKFYYNYNRNADILPIDLVNDIMKLPNNYIRTKYISDRIEHWDEYLKLNEKLAEESQVIIDYLNHSGSDNFTQITFILKSDFDCKKDHANVQLVEKINYEYEKVYISGPTIGTVNSYNSATKRLVIDLDFDFREIIFSNKIKIPDKGQLFISKLGDLVQIKRLRNGLKSLARGQSINANLDRFIFDITKARKLEDNQLKISKDSLLQKYLNNYQMKAVEGVLNSQDIYLIQGPPGTGKTTVIAEICYQNAIRNKKTLIASQTNLAVDNALSKLVHHHKIRALRKGNEASIQEEGMMFIEDNVLKNWLYNTALACKEKVINKNLEIQYAIDFEEKLIELAHIYSQYNLELEIMTIIQKNIIINNNELEKLNKYLSIFKRNYESVKLHEIIFDYNFVKFKDLELDIKKKSERLRKIKSNEIKAINNCSFNVDVLNSKMEDLDKSMGELKNTLVIYNKLYNNNNEIYYKKIKLADIDKMLLNIKVKVIESINKKPHKFFLYTGLSKKWIIKANHLISLGNKINQSLEVLIEKENKKIYIISNSNRVSELYREIRKLLKYSSRSWVDEIKSRMKRIYKYHGDLWIYDLRLKKRNIYLIEINKYKKLIMNNREHNDKMLVSIENTNNRIEQLKAEIENYNKKLPFKSEAGNIEEVRLNKDIKLYYSNLWKSKIDNDIKYVNFIKSWISRIENQNNEDYDSFKQIYINNANVIGITCNQSGSKEFTDLYPTFDMAIIDEVSKATPPELILSMLKARKLVLVGDHRQLPPMIGLETYLEVAKKLGIDIEKTQHMKKSLFEELYNSASDNLKMMLKTQYRMHNQIMETINQFYLDDSKQGLECGINKPDSTRRHNCHGKIINEENHVLWVDVPLKYENTEKYSNENFSYSNIEEVECIKNILLLLSKNLYNNNEKQRKDVGIISFYSNQVRLLEKEILNQSFLNMTPNLSFRIGSVDRFQGIEASIIICSFVRNNLIGDIGFAKDPRRVNVALSRAKELSIIVGCQELFCSVNKNDKSSTIYNNILQVIANNGGFRSVMDFR